MTQQQTDARTMEVIAEIQDIQQQLAPLQQQALQDEELAARLEALQLRVETAMREEDPALFDRIDRLQEELVAAEAEGDTARMQELMMQAQGIQHDLSALQATVLERSEILEPLEEFETAHRARMIEIDPAAEALLDRVDHLMDSLPQ